ncbi:MAG: diphosphokinase / guanosine-3,5-bis(diphosphate) 3-diphosphatase [Acidimicrobiaceae bacterium]|jgi:GTP pyrophosphokinase|nr:diphosphokinase / guanosine-3,5-bis(diphosphate) 3-diphosphatase [Acidimicrobiaceae bacterium]MDQ1376501.1 diphosphokinase / guanosine-3,5-bis(diphosphate) 3-diphosphatase [Acidimicrobiaceae bacterium]
MSRERARGPVAKGPATKGPASRGPVLELTGRRAPGVTVPRVLQWRRQTPPAELLAPLLTAYKERHPKSDPALILQAFSVADAAHEGQLRKSGEAYITHPVSVATILASLSLDDITIAAALLHDAVEDTGVSLEDIEAQFGPIVATIVDGVTKLERIQFDSKQAQQAATMRKMLVAMAKDPRVLLIKLADRLHNMRTIAAMPEWKQQRTAQETLDIYAPLAHRFGIQDIKWQLEDLAFATLHPRRYAEIEQMVATRSPERELYLDQVIGEVQDRLEAARVDGSVTGRPKHLYSIYEKMVLKSKEFDDIYDLVGVRVLVDSVKDCWAALGAIHGAWTPVQGRFKDYINTPKFNLYQSLHTTVVGPQNKPLEVQIRTKEMHNRAERGIAAHWGYKERASAADVAWLQRIVDWQEETADPAEFLETLKLDLEQDEVFVFTPKGDVVSLPVGATPVDFAYSVHTEVGHRCIGARVNGRLVPLDSPLQSGDSVEIFTSKVPSASPSRDWLKIVVTPRAKNKIRQWFSRERREDAIENGKEELVKALRKEGLPVQKLTNSPLLTKLSETMNYADLDAFYAALGEGHISGRTVAGRLAKELRGGEAEEQLPTTARHHSRPSRSNSIGVSVEGLDDVMVRLSRCCTPVPGDEIMGFVTQGRGVSVHRSDCANAAALSVSAVGRVIDVEWDRDQAGSFVAAIEVKALDRTRLGVDVWKILSDHHLNILRSESHTGADRVSKMRFEFELADPAHLESLINSIKRLDSVYDVYRILPGKGGG